MWHYLCLVKVIKNLSYFGESLLKNAKIEHCIGTICFLPSNDIEDVLTLLEELVPKLNGHWRILIVTSIPQKCERGFK